MKPNSLQDSTVSTRLKLAALWTSVMFCYIYGDYFELYTPGKVGGLLKGEVILDSSVKLLSASIVLAIPALMISLSLLLKAKISRMLHIIFGIIYSLMMLMIAFSTTPGWYNFYIMYALLESIITITIVWLAWRWPKVEQ